MSHAPAIQILDASRETIVTLAFADAVRPGQRTVAGELFVDAFVDRLSGALDEGNAERFSSWLDAIAETHHDLPRLRDLAASTLGAAREVLGTAFADRALGTLLGIIERAATTTFARHLEAASGSTSEAVDAVDVAISGLVDRLSAGDPATAEHSRAVSAWCGRLARVLRLDNQTTSYVRRSGLIHDIGKIETPHGILLAPRHLSADETAVMRLHAIAGEQLLRGHYEALYGFAPIVRGHHERLDGTGYPDGLRGEQIPVATRIVSVADSFNAMIGRRPYRAPMAPNAALEELDRHRGTQFDPAIVDAMIEVVSGRRDEDLKPTAASLEVFT